MRKTSLPLLLALLVCTAAQAQWEKTSSPQSLKGAKVISIAIQGDTLFVGTPSNGIFLSTNDGESWVSVSSGLLTSHYEYPEINSIVVMGDTVFGGTGKGCYRSFDCGKNWSQCNTGLPDFPKIYSLLFRCGDIYAATRDAVYCSTDKGNNWIPARSGLPYDEFWGYSDVRDLAAIDTTLFAGMYEGIYRSTDNGASWTQQNNGLQPDEPNRYPAVKTLTIIGTSLYAGTDVRGVYLSTDYGESWTPTSTGLPRRGSDGYHSILAIASTDTILFAAIPEGIYMSLDKGSNWSLINEDLPVYSYRASLETRDDHLFVGTYEGLHRTSDYGVTWSNVFTSFSQSMKVNTIGASGSFILASASGYDMYQTYSQVFRSDDYGDNWLPVDSLPYASCFLSSGTDLYAAGRGVYYSPDHGESWISISSNMPAKSAQALLKHGENLYAGIAYYFLNSDYGIVYRSSDNGENWDEAGLEGVPVSSLASAGDMIFAGSGGALANLGVFVSNDSGASWRSISSGLKSNSYIYTLLITGNTILAGTEDGVYTSTDYGESWSSSNTGLTDTTDVTALIAINNNLFAGTRNGYYHSSDNGENWEPINESLKDLALYINSLTVLEDYLFAGTLDGVWRRDITEIIGEDDNGKVIIPCAFGLEQNYPNPFNPTTTILFDIPGEIGEQQHITLTVYDLRGRLVKTLIDSEFEPGSHKVVWDGKNEQGQRVSSGIYLYSMITEDEVCTRKMIMVK